DTIANALERGESGTPTMVANGALNLDAPNIVNTGIVSSKTDNIDIATRAVGGLGTIAIGSSGGTYSALNGDINIGNSNLTNFDSIILEGGNYLSKNVNINAGDGAANGHVGQLTGQLRTSAREAHLGASTDNLQIGTTICTGDPTFFNAGGTITIQGDLIFGEAIAILASADVTDAANAFSIISTVGKSVNIVAGGLITAAGGAVGSNTASPGKQIIAGTVTVNGASSTGGNIVLGASNISTFNGTGGGDVNLIAFRGSTVGSGKVTVASVTTGSTGADSGDVTVIAGANTGVGINLITDLDSSGGATGGNVSLTTSQPTGKVTFDVFGNATGLFKAGKVIEASSITAPQLKTGGGNVLMKSNGVVTLDNFGTSTDSKVSGRSGGNITITANKVSILGAVSADGFDGLTGTAGTADKAAGAGTAGSAGGNITINTAVSHTATAGLLMTSRGGDGGNGGAAFVPPAASGIAGGAGGAGGAG
ncbi:MAG: hypothetical protein CTY21_13635, partial [Methylomonas sp.]